MKNEMREHSEKQVPAENKINFFCETSKMYDAKCSVISLVQRQGAAEKFRKSWKEVEVPQTFLKTCEPLTSLTY